MKCEKCGEECERDEVDVGVGVQYGPWGCYNCGWSEDSDYDSSEGTCLAEQKDPDWIYDPSGGKTRKSSVVKKLSERFGLNMKEDEL